MKILKEQLTAQSFKFIPRVLEADSMVIKGESTNTEDTYAITPTIDRYYLVVNKILTLIENEFYTLTVYNGSDIVYKDKIFCTNQDISTFSVNNNEYTSNATNNEFIIVD